MTTFLHKEKTRPPDEVPTVKAPKCEICHREMWMMRVEKTISDAGIEATYFFECPTCLTKARHFLESKNPGAARIAPQL